MTDDPRIEQIRAVLNELPGIEPHEKDADWRVADSRSKACQRIRSILGSAPPSPRVYFQGDMVPAGRTVQNVFGETVLLVDDVDYATATVVEVPVLTREEWQSAVTTARTARGLA